MKKFLHQKKYAILRRIFPSRRKQHYLDSLVGPLGYWTRLQAFQLQFLISRGLKKHHTLLDIGCGPLQGGTAYIDYLDPGRYVGMDLRHEPLAAAYELIAEKGLVHKNPMLICSSTFGKHELDGQKFDYLWASQILYHLPEETMHELFEQLNRRMTADSVFFGDIIGDHPERKTIESKGFWREFSFHLHSPDSLQKMADRHGLSVEPLDTIGNFGYPKELGLHTNLMLKITKNTA